MQTQQQMSVKLNWKPMFWVTEEQSQFTSWDWKLEYKVEGLRKNFIEHTVWWFFKQILKQNSYIYDLRREVWSSQ